MAFAILGTPKPAFFDSSGSPLVSGTLAVLEPADDTNKASYPTYDDAEAATNANSNPITLDSRGECSLWGLDGEDYKLVLKDSAGATVWTTDDVFLPYGSTSFLQSNSESDVPVTPTDESYPPGYIERYGGVADGTTNSTTALETAMSIGRQAVKFYDTGLTDVLSTYTGRHRFYIIRDAYCDDHSLIGPANFASDGTQTNAMLQLGKTTDWSNGTQYKDRVISDIIFSGKTRTDNAIYFLGDESDGNDLTSASGPQYTTGWRIEGCLFERCNKGVWKPEGNFNTYYIYTSSSNGNFGVWEEARDSTSIANSGHNVYVGGEWLGHRKAAFYNYGKQVANGSNVWNSCIVENNPGFGFFFRDINSCFAPFELNNVHFEYNADGLTADADGLATETPSGAGDFTLDGALCSGGTFTADGWGVRQLSFTSGSDESGDTYTITGTDYNGDAQVENISGPNATTVNSVNSWATVTQIATDGAATGEITIGVTSSVDLEDGEGPRTARDVYAENVDGLVMRGCWIKRIELIDSVVTFYDCTFNSGSAPDASLIIDNGISTNGCYRSYDTNLDGWGDNTVANEYGGAHAVIIESIKRQNRTLGTNISHIRSPTRIPVNFKPPNYTAFESSTNEQPEDWLEGDGASGDVSANGVVPGLTYPTASEYTFPANGEWIAPATMALPEVSGGQDATEGNWIVTTLEVKIDAGDSPTSFRLEESAALTRNSGMDIAEAKAGEWVTIAVVGEVPAVTSGEVRYRIITGASTVTVAFGAYQCAEFETAQEAFDFYNSHVFAEDKPTTKKVKLGDTSTITDITLTDDPHLSGWDLQADTKYQVDGYLILDTDATADFKCKFDFSNAAQTVDISILSLIAGSIIGDVDTGSGTSVVGTGASHYLEINGLFKSNATTGGDVAFQWAQDASDAYSTTLEEGSWIRINKLVDEN